MIETTIMLKPAEEWPQKEVKRFYSEWPLPEAMRGWLHHIWPETAPARTPLELDRAINDAIQFPGLTNAGMEGPIKIRLDMLTTGIRAPVGIKVAGPDLVVLQDLAQEIAQVVERIPGTISAYPDKSYGGNYLDFDIDRVEAARYGVIGRGHPGRDHDRHRWHEHYPDGGRAGTLPGQSPVHAGTPG